MPVGQPNEKTLQAKRRFARQLEEIDGVTAGLGASRAEVLQVPQSVAVLGPAAPSSFSLDWQAVPAACDPAGIISSGKAKDASKQQAKASSVPARVHRKRLQVETFALALSSLLQPLSPQQQQPQQLPALHIVDFGCGTGNLLLPLAHLFPQCTFTGVDMKPAALQLLQQRAQEGGLDNTRVFLGMIEQYKQPFDVGLALHACGNATDRVLQMAVHHGAAFIVSPCCIGKLRFSMSGGSSFHPALTSWTPQQPGDKPQDRLPIQQLLQGPGTAAEQPLEDLQPAGGAGASSRAAGASGIATASLGEATAPAAATDADAAAAATAAAAAPALRREAKRAREEAQPSADGANMAGAKPPADSTTGTHQEEVQAQAEPEATDEACWLPPLEHPRSHWLQDALPDPERHFKLLAKIADISHAPSQQAALAAAAAAHADVARRAKRVVELDRCHAAIEEGYSAGLFQVLGADEMAKNDLLVGVPGGVPAGSSPGAAAEAVDAGGTKQAAAAAAVEAVRQGLNATPPAAAEAGGTAAALQDGWAACRTALGGQLLSGAPKV